MSDTYLVQISLPILGEIILGTLEADSGEDAQKKVLNTLMENGMAPEDISYGAARHPSITLPCDVKLIISRSMRLEHWAHLVPLLIPYER